MLRPRLGSPRKELMRSLRGAWTQLVRAVTSSVDLYALGCNVLGLIAVIGALMFPDAPATLALVVLALALILYQPALAIVQVGKDPGNSRLLLGEGVWPRLLWLLATVIMGTTGEGRASAILLSGVIGLLLLAEQVLRRPLVQASPQVANLPGWDVRQPSTALANGLYGITTAAVIAVGISALTGITLIPAVAITAAGAIAAVAVLTQLVRYLRERDRFERNLPKILEKVRPVFAFHWQAPAGTAYQATMWLPYLARLGHPHFILARTAVNFRELQKITDVPIILRPRLDDLDAVIPSSLKAVFYANTAVCNSHMIRFPHLTHIQLNHGDSDKIASVSPVFRQYDKNFVAGQAAIDRFAAHGVETRADQLVIVGRPQLESVEPAKEPPGSTPNPVVLYCPTWSGFYEDSDYSSLRAAKAITAALLERGCTVIFRPHPYSGRHRANAIACEETIAMLTADQAATGRQHVFGPVAETQMSLFECFNASDAMVADVSSVVTDYLASGKPFAMAAVSAHGEAFLKEFPQSAAAYVFDVESGVAPGFAELLDDMLGDDPKREARLSQRTYYLGEPSPEGAAARFIETARTYLD